MRAGERGLVIGNWSPYFNRVRYPYVPQRVAQKTILLFLPVKFNFCRKKSATKFLCVKTSSVKVVGPSYVIPLSNGPLMDCGRRRHLPKILTYNSSTCCACLGFIRWCNSMSLIVSNEISTRFVTCTRDILSYGCDPLTFLIRDNAWSDDSDPFHLGFGVRQGSVISPYLYLQFS